VEAKITPRTKAILPVHLGISADGGHEPTAGDASRHGLRVIEDGLPGPRALPIKPSAAGILG